MMRGQVPIAAQVWWNSPGFLARGSQVAILACAFNTYAQDVFPPPSEPPRLHAVRTLEPIRLDGELNEAAWQQAPPIQEFSQRDPVQLGAPTYSTTVRVLFDDESLYISAICEQPREATRVRNLQRDFKFADNDVFGIAIDGFLDKRNAVAFQTTPYGSQGDLEVIDAAEPALDWDARWQVRTKITETYWSAEIAIPWRNLRYPSGADRVGVMFVRNVRSLNEQISSPPLPRAVETYRMSYEAELVGIVTPPPARNVQFNPYGVYNRSSGTQTRDDSTGEFGGEFKWAVTPSTVLDLTVNTDFAQADVDRAVTNLDRFSVFFPERRQFFLENAQIFNASVTEWISPFFSRRIGLDAGGRPIPLDGGARLTSRSRTRQFGALVMRQQSFGETPAADFAVARYSRNVSAQSRVGGMFTYRRDEGLDLGALHVAPNDNFTQTIDGLWRPNETFGMQAMVSASSDDRFGNGVGAQLWAFYETDKFNVSWLEYYDRDYEPGIGLELLDDNYVMHGLTANYNLRSPRLPRGVRSFSPGIQAFAFESVEDGELLFAYAPLRLARVNFHSGAMVDLHIEPNWQRLEEPFSPLGIEIAPGKYDYTRYRASARTDPSARFGASISIEAGNYFDGELTTYVMSTRFSPGPRLEMMLDYEVNDAKSLGLAASNTNIKLYSASTRLSVSPRLQASVFYQRDEATDRSVWNARLSWEYQPLSYLYLVYNRNARSTLDSVRRLEEDQLVLKLTHWFAL